MKLFSGILLLGLLCPGVWGDAPKTPLRVVFFTSSTCGDCQKVYEALPRLTKPWPDRIAVKIHDLQKGEDIFELFLKYDAHYQSHVQAPPVMYIGGAFIAGQKQILDRFDACVKEQLKSNGLTFTPPAAPKTNSLPEAPVSAIQKKFDALGLGAVIAAGLIDGINPCAFTTIIFMLSMLNKLGRSRRQLAAVGAGFTVAIYLTYLLLGFGLLGAVKAFSVHSGLAKGLSLFIGLLALGLAAWSLKDAIYYWKTKDTKNVTLGLPKSLKSKIHAVIRTGLATHYLLIGAIVVGFLVAVLESLCTGQVYLPIVYIINSASSRTITAVGYLLLYNLCFILPLIVILILAWTGTASETMGHFLQKHLTAVKLAFTTTFAALGILVLLNI